MRKSIATVSMSGTLREKLEAIAAARFDGYEIFENDLLYCNASPGEVGKVASDLGLSCDLYQPFRDFEGVSEQVLRRNLDRAERKFDVMQALGARLMLVCSNTSPNIVRDEELMAAQLCALAEHAAKRNLRVGFEALAWGKTVNRYSQAWSVVRRANHPHLGLILDSFHTLSLRDDPSGIAQIPGEKIFFVQMADAPMLAMDVLQWARHYRNFPGQGQLDVENFFEHALLAGYSGPLSLEIFNDVFRETPNRRTALDAMRSLLFLEGQVRHRLETTAKRGDAPGKTAARVLESIELYDPPAAPTPGGIAFLEICVDEQAERALGTFLEGFGFCRAGRHRSKQVRLYRQGDIAVVLNADPSARARFAEQGAAVCAIGLWSADPLRAVNRASALQAPIVDPRVGPNEVSMPAVTAPGGIALHFVDAGLRPDRLFEIDFEADSQARSDAGEAPLQDVDHVAFGLSADRFDSWMLFCRAVLGMESGESLELSDPLGLIRSVGIATPDRRLRFVLNVSLSQSTRTARTTTAGGGTSVHHVGLDCRDIVDTMVKLRQKGVQFVPISNNYYDDLLARLDIDRGLVERMRELGIVYDRSPNGAYLHAYANPYGDGFFFEIVQRVDAYDGYGAINAPARMASQAQRSSRD
jgi:4-hydroxyphenylpyruvate dioxygenase